MMSFKSALKKADELKIKNKNKSTILNLQGCKKVKSSVISSILKIYIFAILQT